MIVVGVRYVEEHVKGMRKERIKRTPSITWADNVNIADTLRVMER